MKTLLRLICSTVLLPGLISGAFAVQRTFVASYGLDGNPCSLTAPCRGFARALTQTDPNGEVIVLDSAGYGAVTIDKPASIIAPEGIYAGISVFSGGTGITIDAGLADRVALRGLTINGQGGVSGIVINGAGTVLISRCHVSNLTDKGIHVNIPSAFSKVLVRETVLTGNLYGIYRTGDALVDVHHSVLTENNGGGVVVFGAGDLLVTDSVLKENSVAVNVLTTESTSKRVNISRNVITRNSEGIWIQGGSGPSTNRVTISENLISRHNGSGIQVSSGQSVGATVIVATVSRNTVTQNLVGIATPGAGVDKVVIADGNVVNDNGTGFLHPGGGVFKSLGNNVVENNTTDVSGPITGATLR